MNENICVLTIYAIPTIRIIMTNIIFMKYRISIDYLIPDAQRFIPCSYNITD